MGLITGVPSYIAGERIEPLDDHEDVRIFSTLRDFSIPVAATSSAQLRKALRFAESSQEILDRSSLAERIKVVRLILSSYQQYKEQVIWGLAKFRGMPARDGAWTCDLLEPWSHHVENMLVAAFGNMDNLERSITDEQKSFGTLSYTSKGPLALFSASTMDGPPAVTVICHAILSGSHVILRPSWRDTVTHYVFQILHENNLSHYGQLVHWPSDAEDSKSLDRQLLANTKQGVVFCSDETFTDLIEGTDPAETIRLAGRVKKYGTGLPLIVVSDGADLAIAARDIIEGARRANGRFCLSHGPVLVKREYQEELKGLLLNEASALKNGDALDPSTDNGSWDQADMLSLKNNVGQFGGAIASGDFRETSMDVVVLENVPSHSLCLHQEFPGTLVALIPFDTLEEAAAIGRQSLKENHRDAWIALNVFGNKDDYDYLTQQIHAYLTKNGGVVPEPEFLFPNQGSYFVKDLMHCQVKER